MKPFDQVLLDTHTYVWLVAEPERLSDDARDVLVDIDTQVFVSAVSLWEIAIKHRLGKWQDAGTILGTFDDRITMHDLSQLPIGFSHARLAGELDWEHGDPFDRMLAAQSLVEGFPLVTKDSRLRGFGQVQTIW